MNKGDKLEYYLFVIGIALALLIQGGGKRSIDRALVQSK